MEKNDALAAAWAVRQTAETEAWFVFDLNTSGNKVALREALYKANADFYKAIKEAEGINR